MPIITIDKRNFLRGQSTVNTLSDGGFSPDSIVEILRESSSFPYLTFGRVKTDSSTNIADFVRASAIGYRGSSFFRYSIGSGGRLYETDLSAHTHTVQYTESVKTYDSNSSILSFKNKLYITSTTNIYRESYAFTENDNDFWTATLTKTALTTGVPHILFEYNDLLYVTNGNKVWSTDGTVGYETGSNTLTLTDDWVIYNVLINGTDIYLFSAYKSPSTTVNQPNKIFVWDGYSESWTREILVSTGVITGVCMTSTGMYFSAGNSLYKFDGYNYSLAFINLNGIQKLVGYRNEIFYTDGGQQVFKYNTVYKATCKIASLPNTIQFLCADTSTITCFILDSTTSKYYSLTNNTDTTSFYSNFYDFERPVYLRKIEIVFSATTVTNTSYSLYIRNELDTELQNIPITTVGIQKFTKNINHHVDAFRLQLLSSHADNKSIKWIKIYYDGSERSNTK